MAARMSPPRVTAGLVSLVALSAILPSVVSLPPHNWDCVMCKTNTMLAGNWAIRNPNFNNTDLWWAETIAASYASVALNFNADDPTLTVGQAKILKRLNPKLKVLIYSNSELGPLTHDATAVINAHPEWWSRDDDGNVLKHPQGYYLNHSGHADLRAWHIGYPKEVFGADAAQLLDGLFFDGMGYSPQGLRNTNVARNDAWFGGKMQLGDEARALYGGLNGGEVWGNAALGITARYANFTYDGQLVDFRTSMDHLDTGFLEGAGCMWYMNTTTGEWIPDYFNMFLEGVINASTTGKTVVLHFNPGPSFPPFIQYPPGPPPPPGSRCEIAPEGQVMQLGGCTGSGNAISEVLFASYGLPTGSCTAPRTLAVDAACHANSSRAVVEKACLGKANCSVPVGLATFGGDPCEGFNKKLAVRVRCANDPPVTPTPAPPYTQNTFIATTWQGPVKMPATPDGVRQAAADVLVQSLAPFLIAANEHVFLQYSWFYEMQDGNIPCPPGIECGMPSSWFPEYAKPLGAPKGPAAKNGYVWTREFAHASVYVDARSRSSSKITWHAD